MLRVSRECQCAAGRYQSAFPVILWRLVRLWRDQGIRPRNALRWGLADPRIPLRDLAGCIGKNRLAILQARINPSDLLCLTEDKSVFYPYCSALGIPVPRLYGVLCPHAGPATSGSALRDGADWDRFLREDVPEEFVIKPAAGVYGEGVLVLRRRDDGFEEASGTVRTAADLFEALRSDRSYTKFVVQERLISHPELVRLSGTPYLQTVRVRTFVHRDGRVGVYAPYLKVIGVDQPIDNICDGLTGNSLVAVGFQDGRLGRAFDFSPDGIGTIDRRCHPRTGVPFTGFMVPFWDETKNLVRDIAPLFLPLRTIGWDVAPTSNGPVILEGNSWWDPPNAPPALEDEQGMSALLRSLQAKASPRA